MKTPAEIALELRFLDGSLRSIASTLERAPEGYVWTVEGARGIVERIGNVEGLLNDVKRAVDDEKRAAMKRRESEA